MKGLFKKYIWLFEWLAAAIVLGVGITVGFMPSVVLTITGIAFIIIAMFRLIPLLKTTVTRTMKIVFTVEIIVNMIVGAALIYLATKESTDIKKAYGYLLGGILYARSFIYFFGTTVKKEESDISKFFAHIIFITVGTWSIAIGGFTPELLGYVLLAIAILVATVITFYGFKNYKNYRYEYAAKTVTKRKTVKKEDEIELPTPKHDEIKDETKIDEIIIDNEQKRDEINLQ